MGTIYKVGDVIVDEGKKAKIIKIFPDQGYDDSVITLCLLQFENSEFYFKTIGQDYTDPVYNVVQDNQFHFKIMANIDAMADSDSSTGASQTKQRKRSKFDMPCSSVSKNSTQSAGSWSSAERTKFNLTFEAADFGDFFKVSFPEDTPDHLKSYINITYVDLQQKIRPDHKQLLEASENFELFLSEAAAKDVAMCLLHIFGITYRSGTLLTYGVADMTISKMIDNRSVLKCAIEVKGPSAFNIPFRQKCRTQLAAYIISMALQNDEELRVDKGQGVRFKSQTLFGILHIGLTPIFYQTEISDEYINAVLTNQSIPELLIKEYVPINRYTDRELLHKEKGSREKIFKCYETFKSLLGS